MSQITTFHLDEAAFSETFSDLDEFRSALALGYAIFTVRSRPSFGGGPVEIVYVDKVLMREAGMATAVPGSVTVSDNPDDEDLLTRTIGDPPEWAVFGDGNGAQIDIAETLEDGSYEQFAFALFPATSTSGALTLSVHHTSPPMANVDFTLRWPEGDEGLFELVLVESITGALRLGRREFAR